MALSLYLLMLEVHLDLCPLGSRSAGASAVEGLANQKRLQDAGSQAADGNPPAACNVLVSSAQLLTIHSRSLPCGMLHLCVTSSG
jgi:hypothetical protein